MQEKGQGARVDRLRFVSPYYHIETWLYQNRREVERIYQETIRNRPRDLDTFRAWWDDRPPLDEVIHPKDEVAIGENYNLRLATEQFPAAKVLAMGMSFSHIVQHLRACSALCDALQLAVYR